MDLVKVRGYGFETVADRRKGAAAVVACGLKEKRLPHQVRQSLFPPPPHCRSAAAQPQRYHGKDELPWFYLAALRTARGAAEHRGNCRMGHRGQRLR